MIKLSPIVKQLIESEFLSYFYLVTIDGNKHYCSAPFDVTMSNGITYLSDGGLVSVEPPRMSAVVDRATYKITFADADFALKPYFEAGATGDTVTVRLGFYNTLGVTTEGIAPGHYFNNMKDTVITYQGVVDSQAYEIDYQQETAYAVIECSSPMADLDLVKIFYTNKDSMKVKHPNDTSFDDVFAGSGAINLKWGKK